MSEQTDNIYTAINKVMQAVGYVKKQKSPNLNYTFAGEAGLISALRPEMVENGVFVSVTRISNVVTREYLTQKGTPMVNVALVMTLRFAHISGTFIEVESAGEGSDTGDKATAKAMTAAYKYALRETFCIETGDDPDRFASEERASSATVPNGSAPANGSKAAAAPAAPSDDAEIAPATFAGFAKWSELTARAKNAGVPAATLTPGQMTKGQVRQAYGDLLTRVTEAESKQHPA